MTPNIVSLMSLQGDIKIHLINNGMSQISAHTVAGDIIQKIIDSNLLKDNVKTDYENLIGTYKPA